MASTTTLLPGNILYGGAFEINEAKNSLSMGHYLLEKLKSHGNYTLMINAATDDRYTAKYIYDSSVRMAYVLKYLGIQANDIIAISSENSIEFVIVFVAALAINATVSQMNVTYIERELIHAMTLAKPKIVFGSTDSIERICAASKQLKHEITIVNLNAGMKKEQVYSLSELIKDKRIYSRAEIAPQEANKDEDVVLILYSSGTTGKPKGVQITQNNLLSAFDINMAAAAMPELNVVLNVIPWCHVYGNMNLLHNFITRRTQIYFAKFTSKQFLRAIEHYQVSIAYLVPPLMVFLAKSPTIKNYNLSTLKVILCGAASLKKEIIEEVKKRTNAAFVLQGYGLTETTFGVVAQNALACRPDSVGHLRPGMYAKVIDTVTGNVLSFYQPGEICFKGYAIMKGYISDPIATKNTIKDGWLHTGDIGYYNKNFEFFIVDRLKELIKYKGNQVPPAELEAILLSNEKIIDAAVIGKPDDEAGELPVAFVVKRPNVQITEQEILEFVAERVSPFKRLRGGVIFIDEIPKTTTGKILRRELRTKLFKTKAKL